jgi:hypothetical protein
MTGKPRGFGLKMNVCWYCHLLPKSDVARWFSRQPNHHKVGDLLRAIASDDDGH